MSSAQDFITMVAKMRDAQREAKENPTRGNISAAEKLEERVDEFIAKNVQEQLQFLNWVEPCRTDEEAGAYNVAHAEEEEQEVDP